MVQQFGQTQDFRDAENTCRACLLRPNIIDPTQLPGITLAKALDERTSRYWTPSLTYGWVARALLAYRSGDAASAVKYSARSEELNPTSEIPRALSLAVRALAQQQLGQQVSARSAFDEASRLVNMVASNKGHQDLLIAQILLREAEAKINGQSQ